jgi:hypothetical protein
MRVICDVWHSAERCHVRRAPAVADAAWNAIIQGAFDTSSAGPSIWIGESGILVVVVNLLCVVAVTRGTWRRLRTPDVAMDAGA